MRGDHAIVKDLPRADSTGDVIGDSPHEILYRAIVSTHPVVVVPAAGSGVTSTPDSEERTIAASRG